MYRRSGVRIGWIIAGMLALPLVVPAAALAQEGGITGVVRDSSGGVLPGVTVETTSPALIERVRTTVTDGNGQYRIVALPVGTYTVTFTLPSFSTVRQEGVVLTDGLTLSVNATMRIGSVSEVVTVQGEPPTVDVTSTRMAVTFSGDDLRDLPIQRNLSSLMVLVPGIAFQTGNAQNAGGYCVGGVGTFCSPNINSFNAHTSQGDEEGRFQGRVLVDGMQITSPSRDQGGMMSGYVVDVGNAQEISFNLSGALGESETGGASINIIPRTGGNTYRGNYQTTYTTKGWFDRNDGTRTGAQPQLLLMDYDVSGAFGGPILRDRVWFYSVARTQGREQTQRLGPLYYNLNAGLWGANYQPNRSREEVPLTAMWNNVNSRITVQATPRNKFNIFWDEQDSCQDPCKGTVASYVSPESRGSTRTWPNRVQQVSWTNPLSNRILLDGGVTVNSSHYDTTRHRYVDNPQHIPQITETGTTVGRDDVAVAVNAAVSGGFQGLQSGSINNGTMSNRDNIRPRLSLSYVTGAHNARIGWDMQYFSQIIDTRTNGPRLTYNYNTPSSTCRTSTDIRACGNMSLYYPDDEWNRTNLRPRPTSYTMSTGDRTFDERIWTQAFYVQDQWRVNNFTLNGALRYDHAASRYNPTCVGMSGTEPWMRAEDAYCTPQAEGVRFHNISPRWGVAWDVFGDGRTAIRWNMGKYLSGAGFSGVYNAVNPARRTVNTLSRSWLDHDGDRIPGCSLSNPASHTLPNGDFCGALSGSNLRRFGKDPLMLDEQGEAIGLATTHCGRTEFGIPQSVLDYCERSGQNVFQGWNKRTGQWQMGIGIQREILPRLSAEVTYNQRWYGAQQITDTLGIGCDLYQPTTDQCMEDLRNYSSADHSFFRLRAPEDPRLPNGGGYYIYGLSNRNRPADNSETNNAAITMQEYTYGWRGVDTNFVLRARGGLRLNGGTSTGKSFRDTCMMLINDPGTQLRDREGGGGPLCSVNRPFQTNVRGSAAYTVPWVDVLASIVFQSRPGPEISATYQFSVDAVEWMPGSEWRATAEEGCPDTRPVGCLHGFVDTYTTNLLNFSDMFGSRTNLIDLKLAKNIRFARRRVNVGVDVYNLFNSDAALAYNSTYNPQPSHDPEGNPIVANTWRSVSQIQAPRFARLSLQFDF